MQNWERTSLATKKKKRKKKGKGERQRQMETERHRGRESVLYFTVNHSSTS